MYTCKYVLHQGEIFCVILRVIFWPLTFIVVELMILYELLTTCYHQNFAINKFRNISRILQLTKLSWKKEQSEINKKDWLLSVRKFLKIPIIQCSYKFFLISSIVSISENLCKIKKIIRPYDPVLKVPKSEMVLSISSQQHKKNK